MLTLARKLSAVSLLLCLAGNLLLLQGCSTYSHAFYPVEAKLVSQDPAGALKELEEKGYSENDQLLFHLNKAMLQRMQKDYVASNQSFELAKGIIQAYDAISLREETLAFIINDTSKAYSGTPLDQVLLHTYAALNYLELDEHDKARVEILQVDVRLRLLMQSSPNSALSIDPFSRYLAGMVFEDLGEYSDAMIAYRKAYEAYKVHNEKIKPVEIPYLLKTDLLRMAKQNGLTNEYEKFKQEFGIDPIVADPAKLEQGELVLVLHNGLAPIKREQSTGAIDPSSGRLIRVSLPYYQDRPKPTSHARIRVAKESAETQVVEQIDAIDRKTLDEYMPAITARAVARAVVKYNMAKEAGKQDNLAGLLINLAGVVTERADTRSWLTLPAEIQMARLPLPAGQHEVSVALLNHNNRVVKTVKLGKVEVIKGQRRYLSYHNIPSYTPGKH